MQATRGDAAIPSLFADDAAQRLSAARPGLLAELEAPQDSRRRTSMDPFGRLRRRPWLTVAIAVAVVAASPVLLFLAGGNDGHRAPAGAGNEAPGTPGPASAGDALFRPAVILDDPPPPRVLAAGAGDDAAIAPDEHPMQLLRGRVAPVAAPAPRRRPAAPVDSDVDLLAALMHHTGRPGAAGAAGTAASGATGPAASMQGDRAGTAGAPEDAVTAVSRELAACPAANTDAGLACRESACSSRWGEHPSCPLPTRPSADVESRQPGHTAAE